MEFPRYENTQRAGELEAWEVSHLFRQLQGVLELPQRASAEQVQKALPRDLWDAYWTVGDCISSLVNGMLRDEASVDALRLALESIHRIQDHLKSTGVPYLTDLWFFTEELGMMMNRTREDSLEEFGGKGECGPSVISCGYLSELPVY